MQRLCSANSTSPNRDTLHDTVLETIKPIVRVLCTAYQVQVRSNVGGLTLFPSERCLLSIVNLSRVPAADQQ